MPASCREVARLQLLHVSTLVEKASCDERVSQIDTPFLGHDGYDNPDGVDNEVDDKE